jgi:hypothetical protein
MMITEMEPAKVSASSFRDVRSSGTYIKLSEGDKLVSVSNLKAILA